MKPRHALALRTFDYAAALGFGCGASLATWLLVPDAWASPLAMLAGMVLGMIAALPLLGLFAFLLAGFEIVVMSMQIGMLAGMAGAMVRSASLGTAVLWGAVIGLGVQAALHLLDRRLHGDVLAGVSGDE